MSPWLPHGESDKMFILHIITLLHTAHATEKFQEHFSCEYVFVFFHPPYSPDLVPSELTLFRPLMKHSEREYFSHYEGDLCLQNVGNHLRNWMSSQPK